MQDETIGGSPPVTVGPGTVIADRYIVVEELGRGASATVFAARDLELGESVAVKVILPGPGGSGTEAAHLAHLRQEVRLARRVTHRNVARTFDIGQWESLHFMTMERIDGRALDLVIRDEAPVEPRRAAEIAADIAAGLAAAHEAGVIHRDLKPKNVLLTPDHRAVITDFGIARPTRGREAEGGPRWVGTPAYMAPEQVSGGAISPRSDLYALGLILFELLTGQHPFPEENPLASALARVDGDPLNPRDLARMPPELAALLDDLLMRDPARRPADARAVIRLLAAAVDAEPRITRIEDAEHPRFETLDFPQPAFAPLNPGNRALAVLPLRYRGPEAAAFVADALTDDLIDALSMTRGLRVPARAATARFAEDRDPARVRAELDVRAVVDGTVTLAGDRLRLTVRLIDTGTGEQTWAEDFEGEVGDVFDMHQRIARRVAESLRLEAQIRTGSHLSPEAAESYLLGRRRASSFDTGGTGPHGAVRAFMRCRELAPEFAPAVAAEALVRARLLFFRRDGDPEEFGLDACRRAVEEALAKAPAIPETHLAAARLATECGDYPTAAQELATALDLAPTCAAAHAFLGTLQCEAGRPEEGIRRIELACELDPSSGHAWLTAARHHALHGQADLAESLLVTAERTEPALSTITNFLRLRLLAWRRAHGEYAELLRQIQGAPPGGDSSPGLVFRAYLGGVDPDELDRRLASVDHPDGSRRRTAMVRQFACEAMASHGHREHALGHLRRADALGLVDVDWMRHCPLLAALHDDPEFMAIRGRVEARAGALWRSGIRTA